jgi:small basic protein
MSLLVEYIMFVVDTSKRIVVVPEVYVDITLLGLLTVVFGTSEAKISFNLKSEIFCSRLIF